MATEDLLIQVRADVAAAQSGLRAVATQTQQTTQRIQSLGSSSGAAAGFARDLGRGLNDAQQFAYGFRSGLVAVSNQVDGLIVGLRAMRQEAKDTSQTFGQVLVGSLRGGNGLIIALNLAISAAAIFGPAIARAFKQTEDAADDANDAYRDALRSLLSFRSAAVQTAQLEAQTFQALVSNVQGEIQGLTQRLERLRSQQAASRPREAGGQLTGRAVGDVDAFRRLGGEIQVVEQALRSATERANEYRAGLTDAQGVMRAAAAAARDFGGALPVIGEMDTDEGGAGRAARERARRIRDIAIEIVRLRAVATVPGTFAELTDPQFVTELERQKFALMALRGEIRDTGEVLVEARRTVSEFALVFQQGFQEGVEGGIRALTQGLASDIAGLISLQSSFAEFGSGVVQTLQRMTAAMVAAVAQALILRGIFAALNLIPGFGGSGIGGFLRGAFGIGGNLTGGASNLIAQGAGRASIAGGYIQIPVEVVAAAVTAAQSNRSRTGGTRR